MTIQLNVWTSDGLLYWCIFASLGLNELTTNTSEILIEIQTSSFNKMYLKMACANWWPFHVKHKMATSLHMLFSNTFCSSFKNMCLKVPSAKCWPFSLGLNVLNMGFQGNSSITGHQVAMTHTVASCTHSSMRVTLHEEQSLCVYSIVWCLFHWLLHHIIKDSLMLLTTILS